jgi:hypothetical protein
MTSEEEERWLRRARILQTEEEWASCAMPHKIFRLFTKERVGNRKALLLMCACVRRLWDVSYFRRCHRAVEILECQADVAASNPLARDTASDLRKARLEATEVMGGMWWQASIDYSENDIPTAWETATYTSETLVIAAGRLVRIAAGLSDDRPGDEHREPEERAQCDVLRCVFGNPFRDVAFDPAWRTATTVDVARGAYHERTMPQGTIDPNRLGVLADALMDAGCSDAEILGHLRNVGPHVRGCWVIDLVLDRK